MGRIYKNPTNPTNRLLDFTFVSTGQTDFTTLNIEGEPIVFVGGALQRKDVDYTFNAGVISFTSTITSGLVVNGYLLELPKDYTKSYPSFTIDTFSGDNSTTDFTLTNVSDNKIYIVAVDGLLLTPDVDFTTTGSTISFTTSPNTGADNITVIDFTSEELISTHTENTIEPSSLNETFQNDNRDVNDSYIMNGDFDIWQRGDSFTFTGFCADRWRFDNASGFGAPSSPIETEQFQVGADIYNIVVQVAGTTNTTINLWDYAIQQWRQIQTVLTTNCHTARYFTRGGHHYVAFSGTDEILIYKLNISTKQLEAHQFLSFDSLGSSLAQEAQPFVMNQTGELFMWVAVLDAGRPTELYKWDDTTESFNTTPVQQLFLANTRDVEHFVIGGEDYVAFGEASGSTLHNTGIYKWNNGTQQFDLFQNLGVYLIRKFTFIDLTSNQFLIAVNESDGTNYVNSEIFRWNGTSFVSHQTISTPGGRWCLPFDYNGNDYIVFANRYNLTGGAGNSFVYQYNTSTTLFDLYQNIPTSGNCHAIIPRYTDGELYIDLCSSGLTSVEIQKMNTTTHLFETHNPLNSVGDATRVGNGNTGIFDVNPNIYIELNKTVVDTATMSLSQRIEDVKRFLEKTFTLSFYAQSTNPLTLTTNINAVGLHEDINGNDYIDQIVDISVTNGISTTHSITSSWAKYSYTFTLGTVTVDKIINDNNYLSIAFLFGDGTINTLRLTNIKLEDGENVTVFNKKSFAENLRECQRYYENSLPYNQSSFVHPFGGELYRNPASIAHDWQDVKFKVEKAITPTVTIHNPISGLTGEARTGTGLDIGVTINNVNTTGYTIGSTSTSIPANDDITWHWEADAEI